MYRKGCTCMSLKSSNKVDTNRYELQITIDADAFEAAISKAYRQNVKKMNVPGFRRGKAPRGIVEKLYGENIFYEDAFNSLYPEAIDNAAEDAGVEIVDFKNVDFDLNVSVNLGGGTKQEMLLNYQTAYKMLGEIMQLGLTDNIKIRNLLCKMLETMGLKDTDSYLISEQELISNQQQLKLQEQAALMNNANAVGGTIDINNTVQPNQNKLPLQI